MSIPVSTAVAVKLAIVNAVKANASIVADPSIAVVYGPPSHGDLGHDDWISVQGWHRRMSVQSMVGTGGAGWLQDNYTIEVIVSVFRGGDQAQVVDERCALLVSLVENAIRTDPSLGGTVTEARPEQESFEDSWDELGTGRFGVSTLLVSVQANTY